MNNFHTLKIITINKNLYTPYMYKDQQYKNVQHTFCDV